MSEFTALQYQVAYPDGAEHHWWHVARNMIVRAVCDASGASKEPILDVGCGRGIVVGYLRSKGIDCRGVELGPVVPVAGAEGHVRAETDALELPLAERARIRTILLLDVVEHLEDPSIFLRELRRAFPSLARVIVTVPAGPELWSNHDEYYGHYRRYTRSTLAQISLALDAESTRSSYFFRALYAPMWLMAKLGVKRDVALQSPPSASLWLHRIVASMLVVEHRLLPRWVRGTSIIAVFSVRAASVPRS